MIEDQTQTFPEQNQPKLHGILDSVSQSQQNATLRSFNPQGFILEYLEALEGRERQILVSRYGLDDGHPQTLENIGKNLNLTRERVRQIEKESLKKLSKLQLPANLAQAVDLIFQIIEEQGNIARESKIIDSLLMGQKTETGERGILFILNLVPRFALFKETDVYHQSWYLSGFDREIFDQTMTVVEKILEATGKPITRDDLYEKVQNTTDIPSEVRALEPEVLESYISASKKMDRNAFQEWGLVSWTDIRPKDVGDKVYLVLSHHGKPEHYEKITEMINKQGFDKRLAHKETVHNELIKDERFVLVGRGIYALKKWGYKKGVVADIISEIIRAAQGPLARDQIIQEVLKQRVVKKNTIIVGLSNRKLFKKTPDNKYTNV